MPDLVPIPSPGVALEYGTAGDPLVVVMHDEYGRLPWLEPFAAALADRGGFRVLVPDFYDGVATIDDTDATTLTGRLTVDGARSILDATIRAGLNEGSQRVGLVGFSMGGTTALRSAQRGDADAVVAYYATLTGADPGILPCPVLLHLAEDDDYPTGGEPDEFVRRLRDNGTPVTSHSYVGTGHSFANATLTEKVDGRAAALAFARTTVFLESKLSE
ncbi:MAG: putative carboxymethylenebutenolidase [Schumannella sp.]|nr:putative carboxymethylenebutenolidase [Schumannella sp.]